MTRSARQPHVRRGEEGHAGALPGNILALGGAIALGIGSAADMGWLAIVGSVVLGVGIVAGMVLSHITVDYGIFERLEKLEKK